jgi:hypothetical protein
MNFLPRVILNLTISNIIPCPQPPEAAVEISEESPHGDFGHKGRRAEWGVKIRREIRKVWALI